jgi:hypothetical protein
VVKLSSVEVQILKGFGREAQLRQKWNRLWAEIGERVQLLPKREQDILLEDFHTAIKSRLIVMERINYAKRNT